MKTILKYITDSRYNLIETIGLVTMMVFFDEGDYLSGFSVWMVALMLSIIVKYITNKLGENK